MGPLGLEQPGGHTGSETTPRGHRDVAGQLLTRSASLGQGMAHVRPSWSPSCSLLTRNTGWQSRMTGRWGQGDRSHVVGSGAPASSQAHPQRMPLELAGWRLLISFRFSSCSQSTNVCVPGPRRADLLVAAGRSPGAGQRAQRPRGRAGAQDRAQA